MNVTTGNGSTDYAPTPLQVLGDPGLYTPYDQALYDLMALCPAVW